MLAWGDAVPTAAPRVAVLSPVRIYRDGLLHMLGQDPRLHVAGGGALVQEIAPLLAASGVDVVVFDLAVDGGLTALRRLSAYTGVRVVVLGLAEDEGSILACARAGIAGYVTPESNLVELVRCITEAAAGQFSCSPQVAGALLRHLAVEASAVRGTTGTGVRLTPREWEIIGLIERGLSNKEIARMLTIQLATVKNHVHNILEKLSVRHRGDAVHAARSMDAEPVTVPLPAATRI